VRRRILQIVPTLNRAGAEKQMGLLARGLPRDEFHVHVCALLRGGPSEAELAEAGVPVAVIGTRWLLDPPALWRLKGHVDRLRPDVIQSWVPATNLYAYAIARACGVPCCIVGHRCVDPRKGRGGLAADRYISRRCSAVVANSSAVRDFYVRHGVPLEKIRVIPNGVPPAEASNTTRRQLLAELGLPAGSRLVGLVGRLSPRKRVKDAIWAADLLKVIRDDVHLLVIGDGPARDRLWKFREQVVIRDKVHFLGHRDDVPRLLPHFDVLWSTSGCESQSNALMEALACGVPVVATDLPGTRELVAPEATGYLVPIGDRAGIARHTHRLLNDAELSRRLGQAGRDRMRREFSVEQMVGRYVELYRELMG